MNNRNRLFQFQAIKRCECDCGNWSWSLESLCHKGGKQERNDVTSSHLPRCFSTFVFSTLHPALISTNQILIGIDGAL